MSFVPNAPGGTGTVTSVTAADTSIVVGGTAAAPTLRTNTLDVIAVDHPPAADWSNNSHKITSIANGTAATDALAVGQVLATGAIPIADIVDPTAGKVIGSSGGAAASVFPPGFELAYVEFTSPVSITATSAATAQTVVSSGAVTYAAVPTIIEFWCPNASFGAAGTLHWELYDGATGLGTLGDEDNMNATLSDRNGPIYMKRRLTPSAASHTYIIKAWRETANCTINAGAGGAAGTDMPGAVRVYLV